MVTAVPLVEDVVDAVVVDVELPCTWMEERGVKLKGTFKPVEAMAAVICLLKVVLASRIRISSSDFRTRPVEVVDNLFRQRHLIGFAADHDGVLLVLRKYLRQLGHGAHGIHDLLQFGGAADVVQVKGLEHLFLVIAPLLLSCRW